MNAGTFGIVDLFSGGGGLSLGAARAGFSVRAAFELDSVALEAHRQKFFKHNARSSGRREANQQAVQRCARLRAGEAPRAERRR